MNPEPPVPVGRGVIAEGLAGSQSGISLIGLARSARRSWGDISQVPSLNSGHGAPSGAKAVPSVRPHTAPWWPTFSMESVMLMFPSGCNTARSALRPVIRQPPQQQQAGKGCGGPGLALGPGHHLGALVWQQPDRDGFFSNNPAGRPAGFGGVAHGVRYPVCGTSNCTVTGREYVS